MLPEVDPIDAPEAVQRVVICSGKVYYDLLAERRDKKLTHVAIIRMEQLYPFPAISLPRILAPYKNAEIVWCQEEPANNGAWTFVDRRIEQVMTDLGRTVRPSYAGREEAASPATGLARVHVQQQAALVADALGL